jgi:hypothetical protein
MHHFASDPICAQHIFLLEQLPFVCFTQALKEDCLRPMHSLMNDLGGVAPLVGYMGTWASLTLWKDCVFDTNVL